MLTFSGLCYGNQYLPKPIFPMLDNITIQGLLGGNYSFRITPRFYMLLSLIFGGWSFCLIILYFALRKRKGYPYLLIHYFVWFFLSYFLSNRKDHISFFCPLGFSFVYNISLFITTKGAKLFLSRVWKNLCPYNAKVNPFLMVRTFLSCSLWRIFHACKFSDY